MGIKKIFHVYVFDSDKSLSLRNVDIDKILNCLLFLFFTNQSKRKLIAIENLDSSKYYHHLRRQMS